MEEAKPSARADLVSGLVWVVLSAAIVVGALRMDRLEHLQASVYSAPGLVPGLIGLALATMGVALVVRALRAGGLAPMEGPAVRWRDRQRLLAALVLCLAFAVGLVGRGPPFWLAAAVFVAVTVFAFQLPQRRAAGTVARGAVVAVPFGLFAGLAVHYVFQELFLVRLP